MPSDSRHNQRIQGMKRKAPYLGSVTLFWCKKDNIPILHASTCPLCGSATVKIRLTPPGDVRPAFNKELQKIRTLIDENYGIGYGALLLPIDKAYLMNKISSLDYSVELITDGSIIGVYMFDPIMNEYIFRPKMSGAKLLVESAYRNSDQSQNYSMSDNNPLPLKKTIEIAPETVPFILDGKSVLAPGVVSFSRDIKDGDSCIVVSNGKYITMAIACVNAPQIQEMVRVKYGKVAKNLKKQAEDSFGVQHTEEPQPIESEESLNKNNDNDYLKPLNNNAERGTVPETEPFQKNNFEEYLPNIWLKIYQANQKHITDIAEEAKNFIQSTNNKYNKKVAVAYSGGKDSLCTLLLTLEALGPNFHVFFADTGLELPEVIENTKHAADILGLADKLIIKSAGNKFWELIDSFGPPSRDYRFCCHTLKAQQIIDIITELSQGERILVFLGQRRYESYNRAEEKRIYVNSFIPMQIAATPIREWNALELWLYVLYHPHIINGKNIVAPVTRLYFEGFDRLGCYLCPAANIHTINLTSELYPELGNKWKTWLHQYSEKYGFPKEWLQFGLWRFKNVNLMWKNVLKELGIKYDLKLSDRTNPIQVSFTQGFSPCAMGGYSLKGRVNCVINIELIRPMLPIIKGEYEIHEDMGVISIRNDDYLINLFTDGSFYIRLKEQNFDYEKLVHKLVGLIVKTHQCNGCGVCEKICSKHVIKIILDDESGLKRPIIPEDIMDQCAHCGFCITHCPLYQKIKDTF